MCQTRAHNHRTLNSGDSHYKVQDIHKRNGYKRKADHDDGRHSDHPERRNNHSNLTNPYEMGNSKLRVQLRSLVLVSLDQTKSGIAIALKSKGLYFDVGHRDSLKLEALISLIAAHLKELSSTYGTSWTLRPYKMSVSTCTEELAGPDDKDDDWNLTGEFQGCAERIIRDRLRL